MFLYCHNSIVLQCYTVIQCLGFKQPCKKCWLGRKEHLGWLHTSLSGAATWILPNWLVALCHCASALQFYTTGGTVQLFLSGSATWILPSYVTAGTVSLCLSSGATSILPNWCHCASMENFTLTSTMAKMLTQPEPAKTRISIKHPGQSTCRYALSLVVGCRANFLPFSKFIRGLCIKASEAKNECLLKLKCPISNICFSPYLTHAICIPPNLHYLQFRKITK